MATGDDRFRPDAALVYRSLRDDGPQTALDLVERLFPPTTDAADPVRKALMKASYRRVIDSLVWMRHEGVRVHAYPGLPTEEDEGRGTTGTLFSLTELPDRLVVSPLRVHAPSTPPLAPIAEAVTDEVSQGDDPWHPVAR